MFHDINIVKPIMVSYSPPPHTHTTYKIKHLHTKTEQNKQFARE